MTRDEALKGERRCDQSASHTYLFEQTLFHFAGMTLDPAYASFTEHVLGSIAAGKRADYVVLSQDIMTIAPEKILQTQVLATVIDGQPVYGAV